MNDCDNITLEIGEELVGCTATVKVGTVTTGQPGTPATVTNRGNDTDAVLDFVIPAGAKGDKGDPGADGEKGDNGDAATVTVGAVTTGEPGTKASVTNSGTSSAAVFDFVIPAGAKGDKGDTGATGPKGDPGADGTKGDNGDAATVTVGTVTTGEPGTPAKVTNSGTETDATLNFTIPAGAKGDKGEKGDPGAAGADGADGKTPVRGTDYWTDADINEIKSYCENAILNGEW